MIWFNLRHRNFSGLFESLESVDYDLLWAKISTLSPAAFLIYFFLYSFRSNWKFVVCWRHHSFKSHWFDLCMQRMSQSAQSSNTDQRMKQRWWDGRLKTPFFFVSLIPFLSFHPVNRLCDFWLVTTHDEP